MPAAPLSLGIFESAHCSVFGSTGGLTQPCLMGVLRHLIKSRSETPISSVGAMNFKYT